MFLQVCQWSGDSMKSRPEFLLEKLVHYAVRDHSAAARELMTEAVAQGMEAGALLAEIVLPAVECVHQLRRDGLISARVFNAAVRGLSGALHTLKESLRDQTGTRRGRVLILSAPLEETDLGGQVVAALAEGHGYDVLFAGAHLEVEEAGGGLEIVYPSTSILAEPYVAWVDANVKRKGTEAIAVAPFTNTRRSTCPPSVWAGRLRRLSMMEYCPFAGTVKAYGVARDVVALAHGLAGAVSGMAAVFRDSQKMNGRAAGITGVRRVALAVR